MKGITFTANVIIIAAVGIIVMLGVIALFYPTFSSGGQSVSADSAKNSACNVLVSKRCKELTSRIQTPNFDADRDGNASEPAVDGDNLFLLCRNYYGIDCTSYNDADINTDCVVQGGDFYILSNAFGSSCDESSCVTGSCWGDYSACTIRSANWNPIADYRGPENPLGSGLFPRDGHVDAYDFAYMGGEYGRYNSDVESACKKLCGCTSV